MAKYSETVYHMELHPYHIDYETQMKEEVVKELPCTE